LIIPYQNKPSLNFFFPSQSSSASFHQQPTISIGQTLLPISFVPSSSSTSSGQSRGTRSTPGKDPKDKEDNYNYNNHPNNKDNNHNHNPPTSSNTQPSEDEDVNLAKFEELKANIRAREAQFLIKGVGHTMVGGRRCPGKKYHPFRKSDVPYPRSYDKEVVDL
jgi:hypothetical protein